MWRSRRPARTGSARCGSGRSRRAYPPLVTGADGAQQRFADVDARARRLVEWAADESAYVRRHPVGVFSPADRSGRDAFADEALYELLPRLLRDAWQLRADCGDGPLWARTKALCEQASRDVQAYYLLWTASRDGVPVS